MRDRYRLRWGRRLWVPLALWQRRGRPVPRWWLLTHRSWLWLVRHWVDDLLAEIENEIDLLDYLLVDVPMETHNHRPPTRKSTESERSSAFTDQQARRKQPQVVGTQSQGDDHLGETEESEETLAVIGDEAPTEMLDLQADFTRLRGIGPVFDERLKAASVRTFAEMAAMKPEQIAEILDCPVERVTQSELIDQARNLAENP